MTSIPASVRFATPADEAGVLGLRHLLSKENGLFDMDEERVRFAVRRAVNNDRTICGVIGPSEAPYGAILLFIGEPWYSRSSVLEELFNFVHPDHRKGTSHAVDLLNFAKHVAENLGLILLIGILSNTRTEAKVRLYQRHLQYVGSYFMHNQHVLGKQVEWGRPPRTKMTTAERKKLKRGKDQAVVIADAAANF